ncbi:FMRFamide receptor-like isoform X1 [Gigantopelta aegis]|uniref:FMRFamide receptor-like isoform X1 n=1 Tax=Gigantopelta aegis TaxID=1735272 RepID=UPI001B88901A|nr:FMRFamide receptor-like isoform X1 [Gigantopelta aegis]
MATFNVSVFTEIVELQFSPSEGPYQNITQPPPQPPAPNMCGFKPPQEEWEKMVSFYLSGVITTIIICCGLVGNLLTVIVLTRRTMHTSTNCFLTALAIWDSMVLTVTLFLICLYEFSDGFTRTVWPYVVTFVYPFGLVAQTSTIWLTVSFTVERYIAVCHPLKAAVMCTIPRARIVIVSVTVVSFIYNIPRWFEYRLVDYVHHATNSSCVIFVPTDLEKSALYNKIYFGWLYFMVMCMIPLCSLAILNTFLILAVKRSIRQRRDMNVRQSRENNVTIMLTSVVMLFIICQVPALVYNMAYAIDTQSTHTHFGWKLLSTIRNFLVNLNSGINFILYCALGQKFRRTFVRTFCACIQDKDTFQHSFDHTYHKNTIVHANGSTIYMKMVHKKKKNGINIAAAASKDDANKLLRYSKQTSVESEGSDTQYASLPSFQSNKPLLSKH